MKRLPVTEICRAYLDGSTIRSLAREVGVSDAVLRRTLVEAGIRIRRPVSVPTHTADINAVVAEYLAGEGAESIAPRHGISTDTVRAWVRKCGHAVRSPAWRIITPDIEAAIMAARGREAGHVVARRLGVSPMTVYRRWNARAYSLGMGR